MHCKVVMESRSRHAKNSDNLMKISNNMAKLVKRSLFIDYGSGLHSGKFAEIVAELAINYSLILIILPILPF